MLNWLPENVSTYGGEIDAIIALIYYIVGAWAVLTFFCILCFLIQYRRREGQPATYLHGNTLTQSVWILIPCLLVLGFDLWIDFRGVGVWKTVKGEIPESPLHIRVTAKQFNWEFLYPGPDGEFGTADDRQIENELHVPVAQVIRFSLQSQDVIHSFFVPNLRLKQDVLPGRVLEGWFEATKPGRYEIPCAELCGFGHSGMKGWLVVHTDEEYAQWTKKHWPGS